MAHLLLEMLCHGGYIPLLGLTSPTDDSTDEQSSPLTVECSLLGVLGLASILHVGEEEDEHAWEWDEDQGSLSELPSRDDCII